MNKLKELKDIEDFLQDLAEAGTQGPAVHPVQADAEGPGDLCQVPELLLPEAGRDYPCRVQAVPHRQVQQQR